MRIDVIGGTGLIGSRLVAALKRQGHDAIPAAPNTGVNTLTGEGLPEVLAGAQVVVDVANSPSFEDAAVMAFFHPFERVAGPHVSDRVALMQAQHPGALASTTFELIRRPGAIAGHLLTV